MDSGTAGVTAIEYPYDVPTESYVFHPASGSPEPATDKTLRLLSRGRSPVLAIGSNSAPSQLYRKFRGRQQVLDPVPVVHAALSDYDVVYSAHLSVYGAVPATLLGCKGTSVDVFITFLTDPQLARMHETERVGVAYRAVELSTGIIESSVELPDRVIAYESIAGPLLLDGQPCALAAISARDRQYPALTEEELLRQIAAVFRMSVPEFLRKVTDSDYRFRNEVEGWMLRSHKE